MTITDETNVATTGTTTAPKPGPWLNRKPTGDGTATSSSAGVSAPVPTTNKKVRKTDTPTVPAASCPDEVELRRRIALEVRGYNLTRLDVEINREYSRANPAEQTLMRRSDEGRRRQGLVVYRARRGLRIFQQAQAVEAAAAVAAEAERTRMEQWLADQAQAVDARAIKHQPITALGKVTTPDDLRQDHDPIEVEARRIELMERFYRLAEAVQAEARRNNNWQLVSTEMPSAPAPEASSARIAEFRDEVTRRHNANLWLDSRLPSLEAQSRRSRRTRSVRTSVGGSAPATPMVTEVTTSTPNPITAKAERRARERELRLALQARIIELRGHADFAAHASTVTDLDRVQHVSTSRLSDMVAQLEGLFGVTSTVVVAPVAEPVVESTPDPVVVLSTDAYTANLSEPTEREALLVRLAELKAHARYTEAVRFDTQQLADGDLDRWSDGSLSRIVATIEGNLSGSVRKGKKKEHKN